MQDRKDELATSLETSPAIERKLGAYERQLQQLRGELNAISSRRTEAEVGFRLENGRQSERLTVIERAVLADYPITGSRKRVALLGSAMSLLLAFALAYGLELRTPVLRTAQQMKREIGFGPVVSIPQMQVTLRKTSFWHRLRGWVFGGRTASQV